MKADDKIYIAGHRGLVGSAILRKLHAEGYQRLITRTHAELDLENQAEVDKFFAKEMPEYVFLAAARVGGINANNTYRADFLIRNLKIQNNVVESAHRHHARKLLFLGSSCIYPKLAPQPLKEEYLLTGPLEGTNEPYAIAKIAGIKLCESFNRQYGTNFITAMPTNLYGPNDNFDLAQAHVLAALIRKFWEARQNKRSEVIVWGTGTPRREFLYVDDMAEACVFLMNHYTGNEFINVGTGKDISIRELAELIQELVGFEGRITFDTAMPDGTPRKLLDIHKITAMGWSPKTTLRGGIQLAIEWFAQNHS